MNVDNVGDVDSVDNMDERGFRDADGGKFGPGGQLSFK